MLEASRLKFLTAGFQQVNGFSFWQRVLLQQVMCLACICRFWSSRSCVQLAYAGFGPAGHVFSLHMQVFVYQFVLVSLPIYACLKPRNLHSSLSLFLLVQSNMLKYVFYCTFNSESGHWEMMRRKCLACLHNFPLHILSFLLTAFVDFGILNFLYLCQILFMTVLSGLLAF